MSAIFSLQENVISNLEKTQPTIIMLIRYDNEMP